jgi:signal transduction protein with GAF and PtsI domain
MNPKDRYQFLLKEIYERMSTAPLATRALDAYVTSIAESIHAERAFIMLKHAITGELKVCGSYRIDPDLVMTTGDVSQTIITMVLEDKKPIVSVDAMKDPRFQDRTSIVLSGLRSILCVPVIVRGRLAGLIYFDSRAQTVSFKTAHLDLLAETLETTSEILDFLFTRLEREEARIPPPQKKRSSI